MKDQPRVLIIESDDALRVMLFTILRHQPVGVDTASNIDAAIDKVSHCDYALVVVDMDMPGKAADRFLARFRERRADANTFVLAVRDPKNDGYLDPELVSAVLHKPLEIDTLAEIVRETSLVVPRPDDPFACPPSESEVRAKLDRASWLTN